MSSAEPPRPCSRIVTARARASGGPATRTRVGSCSAAEVGHCPYVRVRRVKRDLDRLREPFDLVVIGAGIYGAAIAWDATLRGLRVALIDRGDIGGGTSFNNAKTLHGGVRSLQGLRARRAARVRARAARPAAHRPAPGAAADLRVAGPGHAHAQPARLHRLLPRLRPAGPRSQRGRRSRAASRRAPRDPRPRRVSRARSAVRPGARHRRRRLAGRPDGARRARHAGLRQGGGREGRGRSRPTCAPIPRSSTAAASAASAASTWRPAGRARPARRTSTRWTSRRVSS